MSNAEKLVMSVGMNLGSDGRWYLASEWDIVVLDDVETTCVRQWLQQGASALGAQMLLRNLRRAA